MSRKKHLPPVIAPHFMERYQALRELFDKYYVFNKKDRKKELTVKELLTWCEEEIRLSNHATSNDKSFPFKQLSEEQIRAIYQLVFGAE